MREPRIQDVLHVQGSYTEFVDLRWELFDQSRNHIRMASYRPILPHRRAFQKLAGSLDPKNKRCYLLRGSYGTGKSHLCLMYANYLQTPATHALMTAFFEQYAAVDPKGAEELRLKRLSGRYLIALAGWGGGKADFDEIVLRAVNEALTREGLTDELETPYLLANKKIASWQQLCAMHDPRERFFTEFERRLADLHPRQTVASLQQRLDAFDRQALEDFKYLHQEVTTAPFAYDKADLFTVLTSTLASASFKARFQGLALIFDEFGDTLEQGYMSPKTFQQFAQLCALPPDRCAPLLFLGTAQKDFDAYSNPYNTGDFRTAADRIETIPLSYEEAEDMLPAIVTPLKESSLWQQAVAPHQETVETLLHTCRRLKLFPDWSETKIRQTIFEHAYPLHPMATYALLKLAEDVASNNRAVYTFFASEASSDAEEGSYSHYIATMPIATNGRLNLYTADRLYDYFGMNLHVDNKDLRKTLRDYLKDYDRTLRELNLIAAQEPQFQDDPLILRLLRLMLIYLMIDTPTSLEHLQFGLDCRTEAEQEALLNRLRALTEKRILYYVKTTQNYAFKQYGGTDIDLLLDEYERNQQHQVFHVVAELTTLVPFERREEHYLTATTYNMTSGEDKRVERRLVRAVDLGGGEKTPRAASTYFTRLEEEIDQRGEYEGIALYAVCETAEDVQKAREACRENTSERIAVGVPHQPVALREAIGEVRKLKALLGDKDLLHSLNEQDKMALDARLYGDVHQPGALALLRTQRDALFNHQEITWYGAYGQALQLNAASPHAVADVMMEKIYAGTHNQFSHDDFNKLHKTGERTRNTALKEAVEKLLDLSTPIVIDTSLAENHGDIFYLKKCLLETGALRVVRTDVKKYICTVEEEPEKYAHKLPTLSAMVRQIRDLRSSDRVRLTEWVTQYRKAPYGQGRVALILCLAYLYRLFGESLCFKRDEHALGELPLRSLDHVLGLLEGKPSAVCFSYRSISQQARTLFHRIYLLFGSQPTAIARTYGMVEAHGAMKTWWEALPPLARIPELYAPDEHPFISDFLLQMKKIETKDAYAFLLADLPAVFALDASSLTETTVEQMMTHLAQIKHRLEAAEALVQERIMKRVSELFDLSPASSYEDLKETIQTWYRQLDPVQHDSHAPWYKQHPQARAFLLAIQSLERLQDTFFIRLPTDFGFQPMRTWSVDRSNELLARLDEAKTTIDAHRIKVAPVQIDVLGQEYRQENTTVFFPEMIGLAFHHPLPGVQVYVAEGRADPTDANADRKLMHGMERLEIHADTTLHVAALDTEGNWSQPQTLRLIHQPKPRACRQAERSAPAEPAPSKRATESARAEAERLLAPCRSVFHAVLDRHLLTREQLLAYVHRLINEL